MKIRKVSNAIVSVALGAILASCGGRTGAVVPPLAPASNAAAYALARDVLPTPIRHVVIIFQENRTPDYMFQDVPGADVVKSAVDSYGHHVTLQPVSLAAPWGLAHSRNAFLRDYDGGKMDGFNAKLPLSERLRPYGFGIPSEIRPYRDMAVQYVAADHMFQSNRGPSYPAHLYIVSGTATEPKIHDDRISSNPFDGKTHQPRGGGCDTPSNTRVYTVDLRTGSGGPAVYPCVDRPVLSDFLDARHISWRYYQNGLGPGLWHGFNSIWHVRFGRGFKNVISPPQTVLADVAAGRLAGMSWVMPDAEHSDHADNRSAAGPSWVAAVVNAIGKSKYWNSTAI
ncbi:MAG TPA: alkaline phosphatase family protein, partial [Candidatus Tumulicola sp.]|nr:alkaline phosphatase family protein [Candidatus Tumulicola sp.]